MRELTEIQSIIVENAPVGTILVDMNGICKLCNKVIEKITGLQKKEILGQNITNNIFKDGRNRNKDIKKKLKKAWNGNPESFEVEIENNRGNEKSIIKVYPAIIKTRKKEMLLLTALDVTKEQKLRGTDLHLKKMESLGIFAGEIVHDFNNILTVIVSLLEQLSDETSNDDPRREYIESLQSAVDNAIYMTRELLNFCKGQVPLPRPCNMNRLIVDSLKTIRSLMNEDVEVKTVLAEEIKKILFAPEQIHEILINLSMNANDAMKSGGTLSFITRNVCQGDYETFSLPEGHDYVLLKVADTGSGMDKDISKNIFTPFFTTKKGAGNTGLGLSMVYDIVKRFGGEIRVKSNPGRGTTFYLFFPALEAEKDKRKSSAPFCLENRIALGNGERILIVANNEILGKSICRQLEVSGYRVRAVGSVKEAVGILKELKDGIDIVITDVQLDELDSIELYNISRKERAEKIPFLFISGNTDAILREKGIQPDKCNFIRKPFRFSELSKKVREILDRGM